MSGKRTANKEEQGLTVQVEAKPTTQITPMVLIERAQSTEGVSIEKMEQLFELQLRWQENEAKTAYFRAFADFKAESIRIIKDKHVAFETQRGITRYDHATIGNVVLSIIPILAKHGLSHRWDMIQDGSSITVSCRLSHYLGHSETVSMTAGKDDSGGKNSIQAVASTNTYLQRYTLLAITGLATEDQPDDDGRRSEEDTVPRISEEQVANIEALIAEISRGDKETEKKNTQTFLTFYKIDTIDDLPAEKYAKAIRALENRRNPK